MRAVEGGTLTTSSQPAQHY